MRAACWIWPVLLAQVCVAVEEAGKPQVRHFAPHEFGGHDQVFQTAETEEGVMLATNYGTVLSYDGERWEKLPVPGAGFLYGLAVLPDRRIAVCGVNKVGILSEDDAGGWDWRSLLDELEASGGGPVNEEFWDMFATPDGLYFFSRKHMHRWDGDRIESWEFETPRMIYGFWSGSAVYIQVLDDGLYRLEGEEPLLVSDAEIFREPGPRLVLDDGPRGLLVVTIRAGLWHLKDGQLTAHAEHLQPLLEEGRFNRGIRLSDGRLALGTMSRGVLLVRPDGELDAILNEDNGLSDNSVSFLSEDSAGGLWVSQASGVSRAEVDDAITLFDRNLGLRRGVIQGIERYQGRLHIATSTGAYQLLPASPPDLPRWQRLPEVETEVYAMEELDGNLFVSTQGSVVRWDGERSEVVLRVSGLIRSLLGSGSNPAHLFVAGRNGLNLIEKRAGQWHPLGGIDGVDDHVVSLAETADGELWLGTVFSGVLRIRSTGIGQEWLDNATVKRYGLEEGLTSLEHLVMRYSDGDLHALAPGGRLLYDREQDRFVQAAPDAQFPAPDGWEWDVVISEPGVAAWGSVFPLVDAEEDFSLYLGRRSADGQWTWIPPRVLDPIGGLTYLYLEPREEGRVLWAGGWTGFMRMELPAAIDKLTALPERVLVRSVEMSGRAGPLRVSYAAPFLTPGVEVEYRTRLDGLEADWSKWSTAAEREYPHLPAGNYTLLIEARTASGVVAEQATVALRVPPPWYGTPLAWAVYLAAGALFVWGLVRIRLSQLRRQNRLLEAKVNERTQELAASESSLRIARDAALHANQAKSRFLANMSHELRTPLNAIMGYAHILERSPDLDPVNRRRVSVLHSSSRLLTHLINEVLDLSKIEAGRIELRPVPTDLAQLLRGLMDSFSPKAAAKGLQLNWDLQPAQPGLIEIDPRKVEQILFNLVGNAVKFTNAGSVSLHAECSSTRLCIDVSDTGPGIRPEDAAHIFEAFQQSAQGEGQEAGTGLGLAISMRLAEAMGGRLECRSEFGNGATFRLELPCRLTRTADVQQSDEGAAGSPDGYLGPRKRVLVVDDLEVNRDLVRELLQPLGFVVDSAANGAEALRIAADELPDFVLLDMRMDPMDGAAVLAGLRRLPGGERLVVVAWSASLIGFSREEALALGCTDWLPKPFPPEALYAILEQSLGITWSYPESTTAAVTSDLPAGLIEELQLLAFRGDAAGLRKALENGLDAHPQCAHRIEPLLNLLSAFRMRELSDAIDALKPPSAS